MSLPVFFWIKPAVIPARVAAVTCLSPAPGRLCARGLVPPAQAPFLHSSLTSGLRRPRGLSASVCGEHPCRLALCSAQGAWPGPLPSRLGPVLPAELGFFLGLILMDTSHMLADRVCELGLLGHRTCPWLVSPQGPGAGAGAREQRGRCRGVAEGRGHSEAKVDSGQVSPPWLTAPQLADSVRLPRRRGRVASGAEWYPDSDTRN